MRDGYYLSVYMHIDPLAHFSENYYRHDHNFSVWKVSDNSAKLIHYCELERITRIKQHKYACYSKDQAISLIYKCLKAYNIGLDEIVGIWGTPEISDIDIMIAHNKSKFKDFPLHNMAHIFSSINVGSMENVLCLAIDQGPDNILKSSYYYDNHYVGLCIKEGIATEPIPVQSPAILWFEISELLGLREGTLMALASASNCKLVDSEKMLEKLSKLNLYDSKNLCELKETLSELCEMIFDFIDKKEMEHFTDIDDRFNMKDNAISALMKVIQLFSVNCMEKNIEKVIKIFNIEPRKYSLSITGGFALNCPTNTHLMKKFGFKKFISPPCVSDTGISLGMAQYYFYLNGVQSRGIEGAYWGDTCDAICVSLKNNYEKYIRKIERYSINQVVQDIIEFPIVWFQGRSEVGPRALGNRSLLADPRSVKSKDLLNLIKKRQWWRPVAPIVLEEYVEDWFEDAYSSPYMLQTFFVKKDKEHLIPAVLHIDKTARVQTVNKADNSILYDLLNEFNDVTGCPILCNTSLNDCGEPIINTPDEAIGFAFKKRIPIVYINEYRITLENVERYDEVKQKQIVESFRICKSEWNKRIETYNPYRVTEEVLQFYFDFPDVSSKYDLREKKDVEKVLECYNEFKEKYETKNFIKEC